MVKKIVKSLVIPSLVGLGIISFSTNAIAAPKKVSPSKSNYIVDISVPSKINIPFYLQETVNDTSFNVTNSSLLPVTLNNVNVTNSQYWRLVGTEQFIGKDTREVSMVLQSKELKIGDNPINEYVDHESFKELNLRVIKGVWTKSIKEEAFRFNFDYEIHKREFTLTFDSNEGDEVNPITSLNDDTVTIPSANRVGYTFMGWEDSNGNVYNEGDDFVMPVGGATLKAKWEANVDTKYVIRHHIMNLDGSTYALKTTENKIGVTDSEIIVSDHAKSYTGFTYKEGKVGDEIVESTTIAPDGSRVIDLYYSRNKYLLNVSGWLDGVYSGSLSNAKATYGAVDVYVNGNLVANQIYDYYTEHYYGSTYEIKNVNTSTGRQFNGYKVGNFNDQEWVENAGTIGEDGNQILLDFSTIQYSITYNLNGGTNPSTGVTKTYNIDTTTFDLPTPTRTGYKFLGWYDNAEFSGSPITSISKGSIGNRVYYAKWELIIYNLTYNLNGGTATNPNTYNVESATFTLANPTRTGYTFNGWTGSNGSTPSKTVTINKGSIGDKSYTANWTANKYSVVFNANNGSGTMANQTHTYDSSLALTTNSFTRKGYTFVGWNTKADGTGTDYSDGQSVKNLVSISGGSITLYAKWSLNTYTITYNLNGGTNPSTGVTNSYNVTSSTITLPSPTRTGYTFGGWFESDDFSGSKVTQIATGSIGNKTYYAKWDIVTYNITYDLAGGTVLNGNPATYDVETATFTLNVPTKIGYSFAGWTGTGLSTPTMSVSIPKGSVGNRSYTATWTVNRYTLTFNANGGSVSEATRTVNYGAPYGELPTPTRTGYTFKGWFTSASGGTQVSASTMMTSLGATIYAQWTVNNYTLTFNANGGSVSEASRVIAYGTQYGTLPTPSKTGYTFKGWFTASSGGSQVSNSTTMGANNTTVYAQWTANTYTVSYNANGGTGSTASSSHTYDVAKTLTSNGFSRTGYTFLGWSTNSSATSASYTNGQSVTNLSATSGSTVTLYAIWKANSYTYNIKYVSSSGKDLGSSTVTGTFDTSQSVSAPAKTGYTTPSAQTVTFDSVNAKTITFTYPLVSYTITYTMNGGSATNPSSYTIESSAITLVNPTRTGYQFTGWTGSNGTTASTSVSIAAGSTGNKSYTANWKANTYTVVFNSNGGYGSMSNQSMTYDTAQTLTSNGFSKTGYTFAGWATSSTGSVAYGNASSVKNLTATNGGTVTLYAKWNPITYTVSYNGNGSTSGTTANSSHTYDVDKTLTANGFSKTGYSFAGWATSASGSVVYSNSQSVKNLTTSAGSTVTLYAKWNLVNYSITYNLNGGTNSSSNPSSYNITSSTITLANPTRTGYTFDGWYSDSNFTTKVTQIASGSTGNKTLYAKWTVVNYSITYDLAGGSLVNANPSSYNVETATFTLNVPTKLGYAFAGWTGTGLSSATTSVSIAKGSTGNRTYTATWTPNRYTLTYNANGGSVTPTSTTVPYGSAYGTLPTPTRTGYTFKGWFTAASGGTQVTSSTLMTSTAGATIYAQWTANSYTATFNGNGGSNGTSITKTYGSQLGTLPTSTRAGYQFKGWFTAASGGSQITTTTTMPANNVTYYAQWTANTYTIAFNSNGGSGSMSNISMTYGTAKNLTSNAFTRTGYTFAGWATSASGSVSYSNGASVNNLTTTNGATVTLYAKWTPITYTIAYNGNGNTGGSTASSSHTYDTAKALTSNGFTKTGYSFAGWATSSTGNVVYSNGQSVKNIRSTTGTTTLYAKWNLVNYTITYNLNGGTNSSSNPSSYNVTSSTITLANPTRTGYTFGGWYSDSSFTTKVTSIASGSTGNKTFYAKWTANSYTIAFNGNGNTGGSMSNLAMTYGTAKTLTSNGFTKTGYTFQGWATSASGSVVYSNGASVNNLTATAGGTVTLYAKWTANTYTVAYNGNGSTGGSTASSSHTYGVAKTLTANGFTKTGHNFAGWATSSTGAVAYSNSQSVSNLSSTNGATVTLYAKWNPWTHTVSYNANGGSGAPANQTKTYGSSLTLSSTVPKRTGYTFAGWNTNSSGTGTNYSSGGAYTADKNGGTVTLYAKWTANTYKISYNANGGSGTTASSSHTYGVAKTLTSNGFSRTGYTFQGWSTSSSATSATYTNGQSVTNLSSSNGATVTLYAVWKANTYTIKFNANGGSGSMSNQTMTYGTSKALTSNAFTRTGYTFLGWSTSSTATSATYTNGASVNNLTSTNGGTVTLYAVWKVNASTYTVKFNANGGSGSMSNQTVTVGVSTALSKIKYYKTGYKFDGWATSANGSVVYKDAQSVNNLASANGSITLYAKWSFVSPGTLKTGPEINSAIKSLAGSITNIKSVKFYDYPLFDYIDSSTVISTSDSAMKIYLCKNGTSFYIFPEYGTYYTELNANSSRIFSGCYSLTSITGLTTLRSTNVTDMSFMFYDNSGLSSLDLSSFDVSKVTNFSSMFNNAKYLKTVTGMENWKFANSIDVYSMFSNAQYISGSIDLSTASTISNYSGFLYYANYNSSSTFTVKVGDDLYEVRDTFFAGRRSSNVIIELVSSVGGETSVYIDGSGYYSAYVGEKFSTFYTRCLEGSDPVAKDTFMNEDRYVKVSGGSPVIAGMGSSGPALYVLVDSSGNVVTSSTKIKEYDSYSWVSSANLSTLSDIIVSSMGNTSDSIFNEVLETPVIKDEDEEELVEDESLDTSLGGDPPEKDDSILENVTFDEQVMTDGAVTVTDQVESNIDYAEKNYNELFGNSSVDSNENVSNYVEPGSDDVSDLESLDGCVETNSVKLEQKSIWVVGDDVSDLEEFETYSLKEESKNSPSIKGDSSKSFNEDLSNNVKVLDENSTN